MLNNSKLSKYYVKKIILCFCTDITASQAAVLLGRNRNTINRWYRIFREAIYQHQEALKDALVGKVEVDESYFGAKRVRGFHGKLKRGRCKRMFSTHQERLPKELAAAGITDMDAANAYLKDKYMPAFNQEFSVKAALETKAFVQWFGGSLDDILCEQFERTVNKDNTVSFKGRNLRIPSDEYRHHYVKTKVRIHQYINGYLAIFHGPRKLAEFPPKQKPKKHTNELPFFAMKAMK